MHGPDGAYYERLARWSSRPTYRAEIALVAEALALPPGARVLDVGSGGGASMRGLAAAGLVPVGVERSPVALGFCRERPVASADAAALPFADSVFAGAIIMHVLAHLAAPARALAEVRRALRPAGRLVVMTPNRRFLQAMRLEPRLLSGYKPDRTVERQFTRAELGRLVTAAGFEVERLATLGKRPWPLPIGAFRERLLCVARAPAAGHG